MHKLPLRALLFITAIGILTASTALTVFGGTPRDRHGVPMHVDAKEQTIADAVGGSVIGICAIDGEPWPPRPPNEAAIASAMPRGPGAAVDAAYSLGPVDAVARAKDLDIRWSDGRTVYAIDRATTLPTVVGLDIVVVGSTELWLETYRYTSGACAGDQVPTASEP